MNLFYLSESTLPSRDANAVHVMKMSEAFARAGATVTLVAQRGDGWFSSSRKLFLDHGAEPNFKILRLPFSFPMRGMRRLSGICAALLARWKNANAVYARCLWSARSALSLGLPVIYEIHSLPPPGGPTDRRWLPALFYHPGCRGIVAVTGFLRDDIAKRYRLPPERIFVAADGADAQLEGIVPVLPSYGRLKVGFTGQLYAGKGMEIILPLAKACPWAEFHVVGGREPELSKWRGEAGQLENVTMHGYVKPALVPGYLASFDVVLLPNKKEVFSSGGSDIGRWTSPLKLFEYMAAGKAILASDLPVLREVLEPARNAILCDPENLVSWVEALQRLHDKPDLRERLGIEARKDFQKSYSWDSRARTLLDRIQRAGSLC